MRVFSSNYAHIDLVKGKAKNGVRLTWLAFAKDDQYKCALKVLIEVIKEHGLSFLILDHSDMKLISPDSLQWTKSDFIPSVSKVVETIIVKKSTDIFTLFPTEEIIKSFKKNGLYVSAHEMHSEFDKELQHLIAS